jgi:hypothetical protein
MARVGGVLVIITGTFVLITADLDFNKDSTYRVTTCDARIRQEIASEVKAGKEVIMNKRIGGLLCIGIGSGSM